jgi:hypothetical protein
MKTVLQLEELAMAIGAIYFLDLHNLGMPTWIWVLLFFSPDIGMAGYLFGNSVGAITYNLFHHKGLALCMAFSGYFMGSEVLLAIGILLFAHSSFDRVLGYGLKYFSGFKDTHLGNLRKENIIKTELM